MEKLEVKLLSENGTLPTKADKASAGYDIYASEKIYIKPQEKTLIPTDLAINIPEGYVGLLTSRSGVSSKTNLVIETGKIDSGYQGHMKINIKNDNQLTDDIAAYRLKIDETKAYMRGYTNRGSYVIKKGDKLAQLVIVPIATPELELVDDFSNQTERGEKGFGSSGTR